jgi:hypothetical protein
MHSSGVEAFGDQGVDLAFRRGEAHGRAVAAEFVNRGLNCIGGQDGVEREERGAQAWHLHHLALSVAAERAAKSKSFLCRR